MQKTEQNFNVNTTRSEIVWLLILSFLLFHIFFKNLSIQDFNLLVDSFNKIAVGLSALIIVIFGPSIVGKEKEKELKIKEYTEKYPYNKFGEDWELIESADVPGAVYLLDNKLKTKHHILNMKTVYDLGWHIFWHKIKKLNDSEFQQYKIGDRIRTQGEAGE